MEGDHRRGYGDDSGEGGVERWGAGEAAAAGGETFFVRLFWNVWDGGVGSMDVREEEEKSGEEQEEYVIVRVATNLLVP